MHFLWWNIKFALGLDWLDPYLMGWSDSVWDLGLGTLMCLAFWYWNPRPKGGERG